MRKFMLAECTMDHQLVPQDFFLWPDVLAVLSQYKPNYKENFYRLLIIIGYNKWGFYSLLSRAPEDVKMVLVGEY